MKSVDAYALFCALAGDQDLPERERLQAATRQRLLQAGETLFAAGAALPQVVVVRSGLLKMVYETATGDAWVKAFADAGSCFASLTALAGEGASFSVYAIGAAEVELVDYALIESLAARHLGWQRAVAEAFRRYGRRKERRELELLTLSAEARYRRFVDEHADWLPLLRQRDIASFIRVTPVALSRIKARMRR